MALVFIRLIDRVPAGMASRWLRPVRAIGLVLQGLRGIPDAMAEYRARELEDGCSESWIVAGVEELRPFTTIPVSTVTRRMCLQSAPS